jgi:hypothetical protein
MTDLQELRALLAKATPVPWHELGMPYYQYWITGSPAPKHGQIIKNRIAVLDSYEWPNAEMPPERRTANAALIVAAVNALPALLDRLEQAEARIARLERVAEAAVSIQQLNYWSRDVKDNPYWDSLDSALAALNEPEKQP